MASRAIVGLTLLAAVVMAVVPDPALGGMLSILLVVLGLAYGALAIDAEDATNYLVFVIAAAHAGNADVLAIIPAVGMYLDGILDAFAISLYASVGTILAVRATNRIKG